MAAVGRALQGGRRVKVEGHTPPSEDLSAMWWGQQIIMNGQSTDVRGVRKKQNETHQRRKAQEGSVCRLFGSMSRLAGWTKRERVPGISLICKECVQPQNIAQRKGRKGEWFRYSALDFVTRRQIMFKPSKIDGSRHRR
jgi:hypothetical protein